LLIDAHRRGLIDVPALNVPIIPHFLLVAIRSSVAQDALIHVHADRLGPEVSSYMTGVCIEDVNHEICGGIYSQMIFGESFQEPPLTTVDG
jgi:hypothetical protein